MLSTASYHVLIIDSIVIAVQSYKWLSSPFHSSWKVIKLLHETEAKVVLEPLEKWK